MHRREYSTLGLSRHRHMSMGASIGCAVRVAHSLGDNLESTRRSQLQLEKADADLLRPLSLKVNKALMPVTVARISINVNTMYMASKIDSLGWLDQDLVRGFVFGFKIVGLIPDSQVYRPIPVVNPAKWQSRYSFFTSSASDWNHQLLRRLDRRVFASQEEWATDKAVAIKTRTEVSKNLVVGPFLSINALWDALSRAWPSLARALVEPRLMNRFGVPKKTASGAIDIRAIDKLTARATVPTSPPACSRPSPLRPSSSWGSPLVHSRLWIQTPLSEFSQSRC